MAPPLNFDADDPFELQQGRVTVRTVYLHEKPTALAAKVKLLQRDSIFKISNTAISEDIDTHNRIWYQVSDEKGYVHSETSNQFAPHSVSLILAASQKKAYLPKSACRIVTPL